MCILFLAGKDATSYRLKDRNSDGTALINSRIRRWHRDGVVLWILCTLPVTWFVTPYLIVASVLIRATVFDLAFNYWGGIANVAYLGGTSWWDKIFVKVFGQYGAIKKGILFCILLIGSNITYYLLK